jgi:FeS assembly SUF system protein
MEKLDPAPGKVSEPAEALHGEALERAVIDALRSCYDPEIPVNIYELGLIYHLDISPDGDVAIKMTLTSPACPVAGSSPKDVETKVRAVPGVAGVQVDLVWDPPWDKDKMSEAAMLQLGMFLIAECRAAGYNTTGYNTRREVPATSR